MKNITGSTLIGVRFVTPLTGWIVGFEGTILKTVNGGNTWVPQISNVPNPLWAVSFIDTLTGWITGSSGTVLATRDGGENWRKEDTGLPNFYYSVSFATRRTGWVSGGYGALMKTTDGGASWFKQNLKPGLSIFQSNTFFYSVRSFDSSRVIVAGDGGQLLTSANGGALLTRRESATSEIIFSTAFSDSQTGWAVGGKGCIIATTNGGTSWKDLSPGTGSR
jgi:photosystem II stability/assembly factor-like uncharacterized protein